MPKAFYSAIIYLYMTHFSQIVQWIFMNTNIMFV